MVALALALAFAAIAAAAPQDYRTTPVPILKQINRQNDDGSYSFGYESADGSFKVETKYPNGDVVGKYGYIGDDGKVREVEYGASRRGFEPVGNDINVPPPTLTNDSPSQGELDYDDGQYREDPSVYYKASASHRFATPRPQVSNYRRPAAFQEPQQYQRPAAFQQPQFNYRSAPAAFQQPQQYYQGAATYQQPRTQYNHALFAYDPNIFRGHPATNVDLNSGSYKISYSG